MSVKYCAYCVVITAGCKGPMFGFTPCHLDTNVFCFICMYILYVVQRFDIRYVHPVTWKISCISICRRWSFIWKYISFVLIWVKSLKTIIFALWLCTQELFCVWQSDAALICKWLKNTCFPYRLRMSLFSSPKMQNCLGSLFCTQLWGTKKNLIHHVNEDGHILKGHRHGKLSSRWQLCGAERIYANFCFFICFLDIHLTHLYYLSYWHYCLNMMF